MTGGKLGKGSGYKVDWMQITLMSFFKKYSDYIILLLVILVLVLLLIIFTDIHVANIRREGFKVAG